jgi:protein-tyrosine-phosphatase
MAASFFYKYANPFKAQAVSAGTRPAERVHPEVVEVMKERGIDLRSAQPKELTYELAQDANLLITMGSGDECPFLPGLRREDWPIPDPKGQSINKLRAIRDEIDRRVKALLDRESS